MDEACVNTKSAGLYDTPCTRCMNADISSREVKYSEIKIKDTSEQFKSSLVPFFYFILSPPPTVSLTFKRNYPLINKPYTIYRCVVLHVPRVPKKTQELRVRLSEKMTLRYEFKRDLIRTNDAKPCCYLRNDVQRRLFLTSVLVQFSGCSERALSDIYERMGSACPYNCAPPNRVLVF